jgi:hypothetical protein
MKRNKRKARIEGLPDINHRHLGTLQDFQIVARHEGDGGAIRHRSALPLLLSLSLSLSLFVQLLERLWESSQFVTQQKYFSHPSFVIHLIFNPTYKTKIGIANRWERGNQGITNNRPPGVNHYRSPIRNRE